MQGLLGLEGNVYTYIHTHIKSILGVMQDLKGV